MHDAATIQLMMIINTTGVKWLGGFFISMNIEYITLDEWRNGDETEGWNEKQNCWENAERFSIYIFLHQ
jgi:hypothetical protein